VSVFLFVVTLLVRRVVCLSPASKSPETSSSSRRGWLRTLALSTATAVAPAVFPKMANGIINGADVSAEEAAKSGTVGLWIDLDECDICRHDVPAVGSGVLVGPRLVLSAGHCLEIPETLGGHLRRVVFTNDMFKKNAISVDVESYVRPSDVGVTTKKGKVPNDLVLIKLKKPAPESWNILHLLEEDTNSITLSGFGGADYEKVTLYGFGDAKDSEDDYSSGKLHKLQLAPISPVNPKESAFYTEVLQKTSGSCSGDSGGPAVVSSGLSGGPPDLVGVLASNTMPCTGSNALFMNPSFFRDFLRKGAAKLGAELGKPS